MYKVAICDDNCACCSRIEQLVKIAQIIRRGFWIEVFHEDRVLQAFHNGARYDLIFLDIDMRELTEGE